MKILFFDYWLKGVANFERLVPELQQVSDISIKMLHVGSWKDQSCKPSSQQNGFISYDVKYYDTFNIYKILEQEKPDVLVMLNLNFILDRAIVLYCKKLNIKVTFLSHGRFLIVDEEKVNKTKIITKIRKDTLLTLYNYFYATCIINNNISKFTSLVWNLIRNPASMTLSSQYCDDFCVDKILVYSQSDKTELINKRGFPCDNIIVIGNPELDSLNNIPTNKNDFLLENSISSDYLLYMDDGYVQEKMFSKDMWYNFLLEMQRACDKAGLLLVVKLHPRTDEFIHKAFFDLNKIIYFKKVDMNSLIYFSTVVTSQRSTTMSIALILGKRILSPRWGKGGNILKNYPDDIIYYTYSIEEFEKMLVSKQSTNNNPDYVKTNIGTLNENSIRKIVNILT